MRNFKHRKLVDEIGGLDSVPAEVDRYSEWLKAESHLDFLRKNALDDEVVVDALGGYSFIHSVAVPTDRLEPVDHEDLLDWSFSHGELIASYVGGERGTDLEIERGLNGTGTDTLENAIPLVFGRTFEGWSGPDRSYYEIHQEYAHLQGIHWRPEMRGYCRFDERGDVETIVSVTNSESKGSDISLVSFEWGSLEEYLAASNSCLVRLFDFTLFKPGDFSGWSREPPRTVKESPELFYEQKIMPGYAAYTRGVQILYPRRPRETIFKSFWEKSFGMRNSDRHIAFLAYDWRNGCVTDISTDPEATTNYFQAEKNYRPFELSPAFFSPEVLSKYKADRDKYSVGEREVSCRSAWCLQSIDVNEAGQVHAYIRYLRSLPYEEKLHWLSFNESPKTGISERAIINDFEGRFVDFSRPLAKLLSIVRRWSEINTPWWTLRGESLIDRVNTPLTTSRDEWGEAFMDLAKLVIEGFEVKAIRRKLDELDIPYEKNDKTIGLLERCVGHRGSNVSVKSLSGLRAVQFFRTKVKGHSSGEQSQRLAHDALLEYGSFSRHFEHVCEQVSKELSIVERAMRERPE